MQVSKEIWDAAQWDMRNHLKLSKEDGIEAFNKSTLILFDYLGMKHDQEGKSILEIGSSDFPVLYFCNNFKNSFVLEPILTDILTDLAKSGGFGIINAPAEEAEFPDVDEVWIFNLLQHVQDPDLIIRKAKDHGKVIRFFEPINTWRDLGHPWSFTLYYFQQHFGDCVHQYPSNPGIRNFHTHECAYGTYEKG